MHELSIANALIRLAELHRPLGHRVQQVTVQAGPLQAIEPVAMQWAWQAARVGTPFADATLDIQSLPWSLRCDTCGHVWDADVLDESCECGSQTVRIVGGDQLQLMFLEVVPAEDDASDVRHSPSESGDLVKVSEVEHEDSGC